MTKWISPSWILRSVLVTAMCLGALAACDDDSSSLRPPDGGTVTPPPTSTTPIDGGAKDGAPGIDGGRSSCLDRPNILPRAPGTGLPCELIPPGLTL